MTPRPITNIPPIAIEINAYTEMYNTVPIVPTNLRVLMFMVWCLVWLWQLGKGATCRLAPGGYWV